MRPIRSAMPPPRTTPSPPAASSARSCSTAPDRQTTPPEPLSARRTSSRPLLLDVAGLRQVGLRDRCRCLLVDVDPRVQLLHRLGGEALLHEYHRLLRVRTELLESGILEHERDVVGREQVLVVLEQRLLALRDLPVSREDD